MEMKMYTRILIFILLIIATTASHSLMAQNVGIGISTPLEKLHVVGNIRSSTLAGVGYRVVLSDPNGTLTNGVGLPSPAWLTTGNTLLNGGNTTTPGTNFIGNIDAQNICFRTNNIERGRFSALGEFFVGTLNTALPGDLMNGVSNITFPWAINGYSSFNGGGTYGAIMAGNTPFGGVQGEYLGTNVAGAGVRGIANLNTAIGVSGQEPSFIGWAFASNGDYLAAPAGANYYIASDARLKKNIQPLANSLQKVLMMKSYSYDPNVEAYPKYMQISRKCIGFLAQELEQIIPEAVVEKYISTSNTDRQNPDKNVESMKIKAVSMDTVIPVLVEAIKEQQQQIETLKAKIQELEKN